MKLATKFALAFLACGVLSVLVYSAVSASREARSTEETVAEDLVSLGQPIRAAVVAVWEREGDARARELVSYTDRGDESIDVRWTWLDVADNDALAPRAGGIVVGDVVRAGKTQRWVRVRPDGARKLYVYVPLLRKGARPAALELSRPMAAKSAVFWREIREQMVASMGVAALATLIVVAITSWIVSRPLARVSEQARRIGAGDFSHHLPVRGTDEVSHLVGDLNAMCDQLRDARTRADEETQMRLRTLEELRHADRLRTVGTLASGIAHELGTPLNIISMRAKMIATGEVVPKEAPESAQIIVAQTERVTRIVRQLLDFARRRLPKREGTELHELAERAASLLGTLAKKKNVRIVVDKREGPVRANVDANQIEQAITNLVINAVDAMPQGGAVHIATMLTREAPPSSPDRPRDCAVIEVRDQGVGVTDENLSRIFEPFFTTKGVGEGTGLGLSVTHGIVADHDGWMTVRSDIGKGSTFALYLPI